MAKISLVIRPDNTVTIAVMEGTLEEGSAEINALVAKLAAAGIPLSLDGPVESHRHDPTEEVLPHVHHS